MKYAYFQTSRSHCRSQAIGQRSRGVGSKSTNKMLAKIIYVNTCIKEHFPLELYMDIKLYI